MRRHPGPSDRPDVVSPFRALVVGHWATVSVVDSESDIQPSGSPGSPVTIRAGGPLDGVVTITAVAGGHGRTLVECAWTQDGHEHRDSVETETYEDAQIIGREAANDLAAGNPPSLARD